MSGEQAELLCKYIYQYLYLYFILGKLSLI